MSLPLPDVAAPLVEWIATCPEETKGVLQEELVALGALELRPLYRGIAFRADLELGYRLHLVLRTASRIQRVVAVLPALSAGALADAVGAIRWPDWLRGQRPFTVSPILTDGPARLLGEEAVVQGIVAAVSGGFPGAVAPRFNPDADGAVTLVAHVRGGVCTLGLDTAGRALHKRGWRLPGHPAVVKETLAAAVLLLAGYDGRQVLYDPMCGSGTFVIEGAYIALGKAPLIHRGKDDFGFEHHAGFDRPLWRRVSDQVRAARRADPPAPIFASDIRPAFVELARQAALRARVERHITFSVGSATDVRAPAPRGILVANLPYGERIGRGELPALYQAFGKVIRERFSGWRSALLVPTEGPRAALGLRVERDIPLMNGSIPVRLLLSGATAASARA